MNRPMKETDPGSSGMSPATAVRIDGEIHSEA